MSLAFAKGVFPEVSQKYETQKNKIMYGMALQKTGTTARRSIDAAFSKMRLSPSVTMEVYAYRDDKGSVKTNLASLSYWIRRWGGK